MTYSEIIEMIKALTKVIEVTKELYNEDLIKDVSDKIRELINMIGKEEKLIIINKEEIINEQVI